MSEEERYIHEYTDKMVGDALGNITAGIASQIEGGSTNPKVDQASVQRLRLAQQRIDQQKRAMPMRPNDKTLAGSISQAVSQAAQTSKSPQFDLNQQLGGQRIGEENEGKMALPVNFKPRREKDPLAPRARVVEP